MIPMRRVHSILAVVVLLGSGCSPEASSPSGSGGAQGTGGATGSGGADSSGGAANTAAPQGAAVSRAPAVRQGAAVPRAPAAPGERRCREQRRCVEVAAGATGPAVPPVPEVARAPVVVPAREAEEWPGPARVAAQWRGRAVGGMGGGDQRHRWRRLWFGRRGRGGMQSGGCGKARTLQNGTINITFSGASRKYILRVPDNYDNNHPYRLVFAYAESGSSAMSVATRNYFTLATLDTARPPFSSLPTPPMGPDHGASPTSS